MSNTVAVCLIANVGQRDLQRDGHPLEKGALRAQGEGVLRDYDAQRGRLSAPMLEAAIRQASLERGAPVDRLVLTATDQENERFRAGDTIACARVLEKLLKDRCPCLLVQPPHVVTIAQPPNHYDRMLEFFQARVCTEKNARGAEAVYVLCSGGTPACNTALLLTGIERYRDRCRVLAVDEEKGVALPLNAGARVLGVMRQEAVDALLERQDFAGLAALPGVGGDARAMAAAVAARLNFDFEGAHRILSEAAPRLRGIDDAFAESARLAGDGDPRAATRELYWNLVVKWRRGEYADFLGRVWRLMEQALRQLMEEVSGVNLDGSKGGDHAFARWVDMVPGLADNLKEAGLDARPTQPVMTHVLQFLKAGRLEGEQRQRVETVLRVRDRLGKLSGLRNKSIIAYGFRGIGREEILRTAEMQEGELLEQLSLLVRAMGAEPGDDPFVMWADIIRNRAREEST